MWNQLRTNEYEGMLAETLTFKGHNGDMVNSYFTRPLGPGPFPGHRSNSSHARMGRTVSRDCAPVHSTRLYRGLPELIFQVWSRYSGRSGSQSARQGGVPDDSVVGDCEAALNLLKSLPNCNGKVGVIGGCSGGRHAFLVACRVQGFSAVVDCWGGRVIMSKEELTPQTPVAPIDYTMHLNIPLLGLFGNDDQNPSPDKGQPAGN